MTKIDKSKPRYGLMLWFAAIFGIFMGCESPLEPPEDAVPAGYGKVSITFNSGTARSVLPTKVFANYAYIFTKAGGSSFTQTSSGETFSLNLEYGEWTVEVKAYAGAVIDANLAAQGTESFTVNAGSLTISVHLTGFHDAGAGTFKYKIQYPAGATVNLTMKKLPDLTPDVPLNPTPGTTEISQTVSNVPAGFYLVTALLEKDGRRAGRNEVVHIYRNLTSEFGVESTPIVFRAEDFTASADSVLLVLNGPELRVTRGGSGQLMVSWDEVAQAQSYKLFISTVNDPAGATPTGGTGINNDTRTGTSYLITGLANGTTYYVWASAVSANGNTGPKGPVAWNTPSPPTERPASNPAVVRSTANQGNIRLDWDAVPGAETYKVYASNSESGLSSASPETVRALTYNYTRFASVALQSDTPYYVKVIASNSFGDSTAAAAVQPIRTLADEALSPNTWSAEKSVQSGDMLRFRATVTSGRTYRVLSEGEGATAYLSPQSFTAAGSAQVITLQVSSGTGTVKVKHYDPDQASPQTAPVLATVTELSIPIPSKVELTWEGIPGATSYTVYRGVSPTSMTRLTSPGITNTMITNSSGDLIETFFYTDTGVTGGDWYYYQVCGVNGNGEGPRCAVKAVLAPRVQDLTENQWMDGAVSVPREEQWYRIASVTPGTTYRIWANHGLTNEGDGTKTLSSCTVTIYNAAGVSLRSHYAYWTTATNLTYTATTTEPLYLRLSPINQSTGTYGIVYGTTTTRPATTATVPPESLITPLTEDEWKDDSFTSISETKWYKIDGATAGTPYQVWINTASQGNGTKTLTTTVAYTIYNAAGLPLQTGTNSYWTTSITYTPSVAGPLYLKVSSSSTTATSIGTYGIVYRSTVTTRPVLPLNPPSCQDLTENIWVDDELTTPGEGKWYRISVTAGQTYKVWGNGAGTDGNGMKTVSINATPYASDSSAVPGWTGQLLIGWDPPRSFTSTMTGYVYIRVKSSNTNNTGTFGIVYSTTNIRPPTPLSPPENQGLSMDSWFDGSITTAGEVKWYSFNVTAGTTYYVWVNINASGSGNRMKTLQYFSVLALYSDSSEVPGWTTAVVPGWATPKSFTADRTGTVFLRGSRALARGPATGTFGIAYNTTNVRPSTPFNPPSPQTLTLDTWSAENLINSDDLQWFRINPSATGDYYVHLDFGTLTGMNVEIYDSAGNMVGTAVTLITATNGRSPVIRNLTGGGAYYVAIQRSSTIYSGTYRVGVTTSSSAPTL